MKIRLAVLLVVVMIASLLVVKPVMADAVVLEPGFTLEVFVTGLHTPNDLTFDSSGNLLVSETGREQVSIIQILPDGAAGEISTYASGIPDTEGIVLDSSGNLFAGNGGTVFKVSDGSTTVFATGFQDPEGLAIDKSGDLFVADDVDTVEGAGIRISRIDILADGSAGDISTLAVIPSIEVTGSPAADIEFDASGDLFVADNWDQVWRIDILPDGSAGEISPFAEGLSIPFALEFDSLGNLFVSGGGEVWKVDADGNVIQFATGFAGAEGLAFDSSGNLFISEVVIAEFAAGRIIKVTPGTVEPINEVHAEFHTHWRHNVSGDTFTNHEVTGWKSCVADMWNEPDETGAPVTAAELSLASELVFDWVEEENLTQMGPPTYKWSYGDVPEGSHAHAWSASVDFDSPEPFTPGFDASRTADKTNFLQSEGTQTQTLTITLTPQELTEGLAIHVDTERVELVDAVINPPAGEEDFELSPDRHWLGINLAGLEIGTTYTYYVTIEVTPKVPQVEFMPWVHVGWHVGVASGTTSGSSVSCPPGGPVSEAGTWTWSGEGSYVWHWHESLHRGVSFPGYSYQDIVRANFLSVQHYDVPGEDFVNHEVTGRSVWAAVIWNESIQPVNGLTVSLNSGLEFDLVDMTNRTQMGPPTYEWSFGDLPQGGAGIARVGFASPDPFPVTSTPGFDASVSADKTEFSGPGTQTLTVTVTPREQQALTGLPKLGIFVITDEVEVDGVFLDPEDLVDAVVYPPAMEYTGFCTGRMLNIQPTGLELDTPWTTTVTIQVAPKVPGVVEFMPVVVIGREEVFDSGTAEGSSVSCPARDPADPAAQVGTWMVSAEGSYAWYWEDRLQVSLMWLPCYRVVNTPEGTDVEVAIDGNTITFGEVTTGGNTVVATSSTGPLIPTSFKLGAPPIYFDFTTTATYNPPVTVCIDYSGIQFGNEGQLRLWQWSGAGWVDVTTSVDTVNDIICGQTSSLSIFAIVEPNLPPIAQASVEPYLATVGSVFTFDGSASYDPDGIIASYDWDFGDGNSDRGVSVTHSYAAPGLYNVVLTVTDDTGAQSTDSVMAVVYDPAAGFATGGGWFIPGGKTSDLGDMLPGLDNTSPANFGFVVKYKPGATTPEGQLEFQYRQGDFNLHSSGMDWLVIVNNNWAKFQGIATIKGLDGLFPFRVDARDGDFGGGDQTDRFIIKVYAPGADPDKDKPIYKASGDLEGGSIVIHAKK